MNFEGLKVVWRRSMERGVLFGVEEDVLEEIKVIGRVIFYEKKEMAEQVLIRGL